MLRSVFISLLIPLTVACQDTGKLTLKGSLPGDLVEISGMEYDARADVLYAVNDSGNDPDLYLLDPLTGKHLEHFEIPGARNRDWEDLALTPDGKLLIADFGNNANKRDDLAIYLIDSLPDDRQKIRTQLIRFAYEDQDKFPPKKKKRHYDAEALVVYGDSLLIFTKDRSRPFSGICKLYTLPILPGTHTAKLLGTLHFKGKRKNAQITSADFDPQTGRLVLLANKSVWVWDDFNPSPTDHKKARRIDLGYNSQKESICFYSENYLLLADEYSRGQGRNLYGFDLNENP